MSPTVTVFPDVDQSWIDERRDRTYDPHTIDFTDLDEPSLRDDYKQIYYTEGGDVGIELVMRGRPGIIIGVCPPSMHGIGGVDTTFVAVLCDRPGDDTYEYSGDVDLSSFFWPRGFDYQGKLYISFRACISGLSIKYTGNMGTSALPYPVRSFLYRSRAASKFSIL